MPCRVRPGGWNWWYTVVAAQSGTVNPGFELELNDGPAMDLRQTLQPADRPATDGTFWYGLDRSILHQSGPGVGRAAGIRGLRRNTTA